MKHKESNISATINLTRKVNIFFIYKIGWWGGPFKSAEGEGSLKLIMLNLTYKLQIFTKHSVGHGNE